MAIVIIDSPSELNSAYNPNQWIINSTNKNQTGFRYIVNFYNATTNVLIKKFTVTPRPVDGYGEFDISKIVQDELFTDFKQEYTEQLSFNGKGHYFDYKIKFGEEYITNWSYTDTEWISYNETKCVSTITPPFIPGDTVVVIPTTPNIRPSFQGLYIVIQVDIINKWVSFDTPWLSTGLNPGTIRYADNRKTEYTEASFTSIYRVYKSVIPFTTWKKTHFVSTYLSFGDENKMMTNFKNGFIINSNQDIFIPIQCMGNMYVHFLTSNNDEYTELIIEDYGRVEFVNIAPKFELPDSEAYLFDNIKWYDVWFSDRDYGDVTEKIRIYVKDECAIDEVSLLFEDRMGSLTSFSFEAMNTRDINVTKEEFNKPIDINNNYYDSSSTSGITTSNIRYEETITLRTKTIDNREQDRYFEELLTSGNVWMKWNGEYQRVSIINTNLNILNRKETGLRRREIQVRPANVNKINF